MANTNYNNNKNRNKNESRSNETLFMNKTKSDILQAMQQFIQKSIANDKEYSSTVTSILPSLNEIGHSGSLQFCGVKNNDSLSDDAVLDESLGTTPILFALTERIDFGKLYGSGDQSGGAGTVQFFGDIYDEYELKQLIQDVNARTYKDYYNVDLPANSKESYYKKVIETLAASLALYSLIVSAWSFQNMKETKFSILGQEGYIANLFTQMNWAQVGDSTIKYPYDRISDPNAKYKVPFQNVYSNADWLQRVVSKLSSVWLPEKTAQFWREIFGGVFMLPSHESVDRGAIQLVKFIPQFTYNFDDLTSDDNMYNLLFYKETDRDEFEAVLDSLANTVEENLSVYPWLQSTLESLGCNFHGFTYHLDGSGNITSDKCDDFTRALTAKNMNLIYDSTGDIRNALQAVSLINYRYYLAEEASENSLPYLYMPYELCSQNKSAPMMRRMFDSFVVTDIRTTMIANKTNFASLLKGNLDLPILHIIVANLSTNTRNPQVVKSAVVKLLITPGFRYFFNVSVGNSLANVCTYYDIIQDSCSIPLTKVVLKGSQGTAPTQPLTQASLWPVESLSMYDGYDPTGYEDIDRARAARRYLFMYKSFDSNDNKTQTNRNKNKNRNRNSNNNRGGTNEEKPGSENNSTNNNNNSNNDKSC